jgi:lipopolysaccharide transport system permease protein
MTGRPFWFRPLSNGVLKRRARKIARITNEFEKNAISGAIATLRCRASCFGFDHSVFSFRWVVNYPFPVEPVAHEVEGVSVALDEPTSEATTPPPAKALNSTASEPPLTVVEPRGGFTFADLGELWRYRELGYFLVLREMKLRYKQTILGVGWSLFQPVATALVFIVFIGWMGKTAEGVPNYVLHVLLGVLPWTYFASALNNAGNSLVANERLVTKVYFPRLLLPLSNVGSATVDFGIALGLIAIVMAWTGVAPAWTIVFAPLAILLLALLATGLGVLLSALIVAQRDFRYLLNFGIQLWMFATPCIYLGRQAVGPRGEQVLALNPMYGIILTFRNLVLGHPMDAHSWQALGFAAFLTVTLLLTGLVYFRRVERTFADTI